MDYPDPCDLDAYYEAQEELRYERQAAMFCEDCMIEDHDTCSLTDQDCLCCRDTLDNMPITVLDLDESLCNFEGKPVDDCRCTF